MASSSGTLETLALQVGTLLQPLESLLGPDFFFSLGAELPREIAGDPTLVSKLSAASSAAGALEGDISTLATAIGGGNTGSIVSAGLALIADIGKLISALVDVGNALNQAASGLSGADMARLQAFAPTMAARTMEYMLVGYLTEQLPTLASTLDVLGLIDREFVSAPSLEVSRAPFAAIPRRFYFDRITQLLTSPGNYLQQTFGWGSNTFDGGALLLKIQAFLESLGIPAAIYTAPGQPPVLEAYIFNLQVDPSTAPPGLKMEVSLPGSNIFDQTVPFSTLWQGTVHAQANYAAGVGVTLRPPFTLNAQPPSGTVDVDLQLGLQAQKSETDPIVILGVAGGSRLQVTSIGASLGLNASLATSGGAFSPETGVQLKGGKLFIDLSGADGFLSTITAGNTIQAGFDLAATWAPDTGLHITGGAQLEIDLPLHLTVGPISIETIYLVGGLAGSGLTLELSAALGAGLGPIQVSVDRVGMKALLSFPDHGGNLGPADLAISFKPPNGLGLAIDAGVIAGGGYVFLDPDKGEYAGVLDAALLDVVQIKIIAVLDTTMPDGSKGFAFLLIITFDLPPIQLSFGFTLNGVGGLVGINRTSSTDALSAGFRAHTLNSVLFPPDPVKNAPQIISNIRNFFPAADGRFLIGPMVEIGWGTPTLITLSVGVFVEVPDPVRIILLGLIDAGLPTTEEALIELHIDILGILDFGAKTLSIDGSLFDSRVLVFSMQGDLALRLSWGDNPSFLYSLGGFNPHFNTTGLNVPTMHRCSVSIGDGDNPRISANNYFAITSNSVQFGANVEAYAAAGGFAIHGYLGFDLIVIFSPFSFEFDFSAGFDVSFEGATLLGLHVNGTFSGPRPWHLHGDAEIDILFFSISASVDLTWGDSTPVVIPQKPVLPDLLPALQDPRNWSAALPDGTTQGVSFSARKPDDHTLLVHPIGTLSVREKVVPLDLPIARYGNATPADGSFFSISDVQINNQEETRQSFQDYFAAAQFLTLSDADKLSRPSFERYDAGVTIGSTAPISGADSARTVTYEERYIDDPASFSRLTGIYRMPADVHGALVAQGAGYLSPLKNTGMTKYRSGPATPAITTQDPDYVVASVDDLSVRSDIASSGGVTYFQARASLKSYLVTHPEEAANLQILPAHEAAA